MFTDNFLKMISFIVQVWVCGRLIFGKQLDKKQQENDQVKNLDYNFSHMDLISKKKLRESWRPLFSLILGHNVNERTQSLAKTFATILATMWTVAKMLHSDRLASGLQVESKSYFENGDW